MAGGRQTLLDLNDKLFQHYAKVVIGLGRQQGAIALKAGAIGSRIVLGEALCHAPVLACRAPRVTLERQRK
jgi:hypothetical protein